MPPLLGPWLLSAMMLLGHGSLAPAQSSDAMPPAPVVVTEALEQDMAPMTWFPGTVISRNDARLAAEGEGRLVEVAEIGTHVLEGDVVVRLDDSLLRQEVAEDEAVVARERARLEFYEREVRRLQKLSSGNNVAQNQLDEALSNRAVTRSELAAARARLAGTTERLRRMVVRAPFSGVVTEKIAQTGEWAEAGTSVIRLVDSRSVEVQAWVPVNALAFVHPGAELLVQANPRSTNARVRTIVPVGDDRSRLYELRLSLGDSEWPAGQTLRVAVPTASPERLTVVPRDALVLRRDGTTVYRIRDDNIAEAVSVVTGIASGELIAVSAIRPGDRVVTRGGERLRPGQKVEIVPIPGSP